MAGALTDVSDVFVAPAGVGGGARMAFGRDGMLYVTTGGGGGNGPQDPNNHAGKVLRLNDDGASARQSVRRSSGYRPKFALGIVTLSRWPFSGTGELWENENGPKGGDEINILRPGANYGWPIVSLGRVYSGPWQSPSAVFYREGFEQPIVYWTPAIAVSGMAFYTGDRLPKWKGNVSWDRCARARFPGRVTSNESCSTRRWRSCDGSHCSSRCVRESVTSGKGPMACCIC